MSWRKRKVTRRAKQFRSTIPWRLVRKGAPRYTRVKFTFQGTAPGQVRLQASYDQHVWFTVPEALRVKFGFPEGIPCTAITGEY